MPPSPPSIGAILKQSLKWVCGKNKGFPNTKKFIKNIIIKDNKIGIINLKKLIFFSFLINMKSSIAGRKIISENLINNKIEKNIPAIQLFL